MKEVIEVTQEFREGTLRYKVNLVRTKDSKGNLKETSEDKKINASRKLEAYRKAAGLLTGEEIRKIRTSLGLSQKEFSLLLGLGEISIARFETKLAQSKTIDNLIRSVTLDPLSLYDKFIENKRDLSLETREKMVKKIKAISGSDKYARFAKERELRFLMLPYLDEVSLTGDMSLSLEAIASLVFLGKDQEGSITRNRLNKFLFYCDFLSFSRLGKGMTGLVYKKVEDGVEPRFLDEILSYSYFTKKWKVVFDKGGTAFLQERVFTKEKCILLPEQKEIAKEVKEWLSAYSERELSLLCLNEKPLKRIKKENLIDYSLSTRLSKEKSR